MAAGTKRRALAAALLCAGSYSTPLVAAQPAFADVKAAYRPTEGQLLDRRGELLHELRIEPRGRRWPWTRLEDLSPALLTAVIQAEDRRYYTHPGVDALAILAAGVNRLWQGRVRGASTITMQLAALLDPRLRASAGRRGWQDKLAQIGAALALERHWSKQQILEAYLNLAHFRGEVQGIAAASRALLDKWPRDLSMDEAALLVALLRGPNADPKTVAARACAVRRALPAPVDCGAVHAIARTALNAYPDRIQQPRAAPQVAHRLLSRTQPRVQTSLDGRLQRYAGSALRQQLAVLANQQVRDGAVLVVDNDSGQVLAYVGNSGRQSSAPYVDGIRALRQAGSTLKPFLYELALERQLLTAASWLDDTPINLTTPSGLYVPQNYDRSFYGPVSARYALASSLNVPAVRVLMLVGVDAYAERLRRLGFGAITEPGDFYGYSLALGSAEVSLWQLVGAYRDLARGQLNGQLTLLKDEPGSLPVTPSRNVGAQYIVNDILADSAARTYTFGLGNPLRTRYWSAVKTGTSKDMRDNWCVGFTDRYTVGVWVGNFSGASMWDVSGISGAAPVWLSVMDYLQAGQAVRVPEPPAGLVRAEVRFASGAEPARDEWFLAGTEFADVRPATPDTARPRITAPGNGSVIALDPDIPAERQRVLLRMVAGASDWRLRIDGRPLSGSAVYWQPLPGRHQLVLEDHVGVPRDTVGFEVRGWVYAAHRHDGP
jgi:penicillin-binding protein 1C